MLNRRQRIAQSFARPHSDLVAAGLASVTLAVIPESGAADLLYRFCVLNYFILFLRLRPLLELDDYWILSEWGRARPIATPSTWWNSAHLTTRRGRRCQAQRARRGWMALPGRTRLPKSSKHASN
jgi:hypothetical protein